MVQVKLNVPPEIAKSSRTAPLEIVLTAPAPQTIQRITITLREEFTTWKDEDKETKKIELGKIEEHAHFEMRAGETKTLHLNLPFNLELSPSHTIAARGGIMGAAGKVFSKLNQDRAEFYIAANVTVHGAALDAKERKPIRFV